MKRIMSLAVAAILLTLALPALADDGKDHDHGKEAAKSVELTGEVLDSACYFSHGAKGKKHSKCAVDCLTKKGLPAAFLSADGKLFLLTADHGQEAVLKNAHKAAGKQITITGKIVKKADLQAFMIESIKQD